MFLSQNACIDWNQVNVFACGDLNCLYTYAIKIKYNLLMYLIFRFYVF